MPYYLDLFSPETYEAFGRSDRTISGFRPRQRSVAGKIQPGNKLICYMTRPFSLDWRSQCRRRPF